MKLKDFEKLVSGTEVVIKRRRAKLEGSIHISGGFGQTNISHPAEYGWGEFRYLDTGRRVTKRNRQVELAPKWKEDKMTRTAKKIEQRLMSDLLTMAETSKQYLNGEQWAVNAVAMARMIFGQEDPRKPLFITEPSNDGITVQSMEFLKKNLSKLGPIVRIRGYKDENKLEEFDYWVEFADRNHNTIRVSGFSWGYGGEGPNGLADACKLVGFPLTLSDIAGIPMETNWEKFKSN